MDQVYEVSRDDLLKDKPTKSEDSRVIFVADRRPVFKQLPAILKKHFPVLQNDVKLKTVFQSPPMVAFRRAKNIRNFVVCSDIRNEKVSCSNSTIPCGKCKLCKNIMNRSPRKIWKGPIRDNMQFSLFLLKKLACFRDRLMVPIFLICENKSSWKIWKGPIREN